MAKLKSRWKEANIDGIVNIKYNGFLACPFSFCCLLAETNAFDQAQSLHLLSRRPVRLERDSIQKTNLVSFHHYY